MHFVAISEFGGIAMGGIAGYNYLNEYSTHVEIRLTRVSGLALKWVRLGQNLKPDQFPKCTETDPKMSTICPI